MQPILMFIKEKEIQMLERESGVWRVQNIRGNSVTPFEREKLNETLNMIAEELVNEYNLSSGKELEISVAGAEDKELVHQAAEVLKQLAVVKQVELDCLVEKVYEILSKTKPEIREYGMNYGFWCYQMINSRLQKKQFQLLAYTVSTEEFLRCI